MEKRFTYRLGKINDQDKRPVRLHSSYDVTYWCGRFDCSREELREAVNSVGHRAGEVARFLNRRERIEAGYQKGGFVDFFREV